MSGSNVEWIPTTPDDAAQLTNKAVVAGYEGHDGSPLWVIRSWFECNLIPGKLAINHKSAYVPWGGQEYSVLNIEVCCACPGEIQWVEASNGATPCNAIVAGKTPCGESLYVGRAKHCGSLTPGKVQPSHGVMYMSFGGEEIKHTTYEVMCACAC